MLILKGDKVSSSHKGVATNQQQATKRFSKYFKGSKQATSNQ